MRYILIKDCDDDDVLIPLRFIERVCVSGDKEDRHGTHVRIQLPGMSHHTYEPVLQIAAKIDKARE